MKKLLILIGVMAVCAGPVIATVVTETTSEESVLDEALRSITENPSEEVSEPAEDVAS